MAALLAAAIAYVALAPVARRASDTPSIVFVVLDTVRFDRTSLAEGLPRDTTPFLAELASRGTSFRRARATADWTLPSHASLFTGLLPSEHGCHFEHRWLPLEVLTLAESLQRAEYLTAAFSANPNVSRAFNFDQGFDEFVEVFAEPAVRSGRDSSGVLLERLDSWLAARGGKRFFLFVNLMDAHLPYVVGEEPVAAGEGLPTLDPKELGAPDFLDRVLAGERELTTPFVRALEHRYDAGLRTVDRRLRELFDLLARHRALDGSLIVVCSDHGEHLGEGGLVDHHGALSEAVLRVPLVVAGPGLPQGKVVDAAVGLEQVPRWLLAFLNEGFRFDAFNPPVPVAERHPAVAILERLEKKRPAVNRTFLAERERAVAAPDGTFKLLVTERPENGEGARERLFALGPGSAEEQAIDAPETLASLRTALEQRRPRRIVETFAPEALPPAEATAAVVAELRQLGYGGMETAGSASIHAQIHLDRGSRAFARGDFAAARAEYVAASKIDPTFAAAFFDIAVAAEKQGAPKDEQASAWKRYLDVALKHSPDDTESIQAAYVRIAALEPPR